MKIKPVKTIDTPNYPEKNTDEAKRALLKTYGHRLLAVPLAVGMLSTSLTSYAQIPERDYTRYNAECPINETPAPTEWVIAGDISMPTPTPEAPTLGTPLPIIIPTPTPPPPTPKPTPPPEWMVSGSAPMPAPPAPTTKPISIELATMGVLYIPTPTQTPIPVSDNLVKIVLNIDKTEYFVNDKSMTSDVAPMLHDGRTMVPVRFIAEALGASVEWDEAASKVTIEAGDKRLDLFIGKSLPGTDVAPFLENGRTMVPLRYISETFGARVYWDAETGTITIER